ncbi:MAG: hypothetical protein Q7U04_08275 [Bacteriovorax sp.]|nr:hypothetical protein [Bacteriovorax sp.]
MLTTQQSRPLKIDRLQIIKPDELERIKRVGIKNGLKKDFLFPDISKPLKPLPLPSPGLSFGNLAPELPTPKETRKSSETKPANDLKEVTKNNLISRPLSRLSDDGSGHIYFNPKKEKIIRRNQEQDNFKEEAFKNLPVSPNNPVAQKMSNFEIRYERPEGISESELNSDEKAYYSFFKRSYANYLTKLYATYEKISVERPGLEKDFSNKHVLIGRIDYDDKGNIVLVKILKSSDSDDVHYFFEETLKQLNLPNPPKSFIKSKKQFTTYYQIQIN